MENLFSRTELIFGKDNVRKLFDLRVAVFGLGGVGSYIVEALIRSGIGNIDIFDGDKISISNINRQLYATTKTIGKHKVDVAAERILDINPSVNVSKHNMFVTRDNIDSIDFTRFDYIADAIDTITSKILIIEKAKDFGIKIISSMGTGNKINPLLFEVTDIYKTKVCPLAKVMRYELKKRGIDSLKVVYSKEEPIREKVSDAMGISNEIACFDDNSYIKKRSVPGSNSFVPPVAGFIMASEIIKDLINH